ncbi:MAG: tetratricopeptide repeat protein [Bacteroidia bacterium]|nr:tetratricopeptide repeat protein [Bacteroidia bacterium]
MIRKNYIFWVTLPLFVLVFSCKSPQQTVKMVVPDEESKSLSLLTDDQKQQFQYLFVEGIKQRTIGNAEEAIKIFSRCLEMDPSSSSSLYEIANIHILRSDFQSAMMMLERASSLNPKNQYYLILLAKIFQQNKLYEKAAETFGTLSALSPDNTDYPIFRAEMFGMAGKMDDALACYDELEKKWGITEQVSLGKQGLFLKQGKKQEAYLEIEKLVTKFQGDTKYYGLLADMYLADSLMDKSLENYNKVLQYRPNDGFVHFSLSNYYKVAGNYAKSFEHLKIGFENTGLELDAKIQMYMLLSQSEDHHLTEQQQLELINILIDKHVDDERPRALLAEFYLAKKQSKEAREQLRLVLEINKGNYAYWERLLFIDNDLTDWKSLSQDSKAAIKYFPEQPVLYILDAVSMLQLGNYQDIFAVLDSAEANATNNNQVLSQIYTYRAEAYYKQKKYNEAYTWFDKVVKIDPQNYLAMNNYAYYLSLRSIKLDVAEKLSSAVVQSNPNNATYLDTYAWVLFKKKDYQLAKFYMESALSNSTEENPVLVEHYGDILFFLNEKEKAVQQWKKSLKMGNPSKVLPEKIKTVTFFESVED